ncbi:MAG: hypothetical protein U0Q22_08610 [Acidimicrobiales bacterium]
MPGPRVYIHEFVDIIGHQRAKYMYHMTANWGPVGRAERDQLCFGVWGVVGSTGHWPQVVNLWEYADWAALGRNFEVEQQGGGLQDPSLEEWWAAAAEFRSGGRDRVLVAPDWSPSVADHEARAAEPAAGYVHELVRCRPGTDAELLDRVRDTGVTAHAVDGLTLVGAFRRAMTDDDECVLIWSFATWQDWAEAERSDATGGAAVWRAGQRDIVTGRERILLADAPLSPLRTGRQPGVADRIGP